MDGWLGRTLRVPNSIPQCAVYLFIEVETTGLQGGGRGQLYGSNPGVSVHGFHTTTHPNIPMTSIQLTNTLGNSHIWCSNIIHSPNICDKTVLFDIPWNYSGQTNPHILKEIQHLWSQLSTVNHCPRWCAYSSSQKLVWKLEIVDQWSTRIPLNPDHRNSNDPCDLDLWPIDLEMVCDTSWC